MNVSVGNDEVVLNGLHAAGGRSVLDLHSDPHHNRAVLTLAGPNVEKAARAVAAAGVAHIDLGNHVGAHPRLGAVDVVPFAPLEGSSMEDAVRARDEFAVWAGEELGVPCFLYGPERSLPDVRRHAFASLAPDTGPAEPHPTAGAICVGARPVLIAYNVWLQAGTRLEVAKHVADAVRGPAVRTLAFELEGVVQVSMNLLDWRVMGPAEAFDSVVRAAERARAEVVRAELVGLLPEAALERIREERRSELHLSATKTIEDRLRMAGVR